MQTVREEKSGFHTQHTEKNDDEMENKLSV
jgi:hypothetical protein